MHYNAGTASLVAASKGLELRDFDSQDGNPLLQPSSMKNLLDVG